MNVISPVSELILDGKESSFSSTSISLSSCVVGAAVSCFGEGGPETTGVVLSLW